MESKYFYNQDFAQSTLDSIKYQGSIRVNILDGNRIISTKNYSNSGTTKLFSFLTACLKGDFETAADNRPCKLILLKSGADENFDPGEGAVSAPTSAFEGTDFWKEGCYLAPPVHHNKAIVGTATAVTYSFRVPFLILGTGAVKKMALITENSTDYKDICAYYILNEPIEIPASGGNYTILVDWTLSFSNKTESN